MLLNGPRRERGGRAVRSAAALTALLAAVSCGSTDQPLSEVEAQEAAENLFEAAPEVLATGDTERFCDEFAADVTMCLKSLEGGISSAPLPTPSPTVDLTQSRTGSWVASVTGQLEGGEAFESDIEFVRVEDGTVRAVDPVYWVDRVVDID